MSTVAVIGACAIGGCVAVAAASCGHQVTLCASAAPWLSRLCGPSTVVVLLQNGLGQQDQQDQLAPLTRVLPAVVYVAAERVSPGRIVHRSDSRIAVPAGSDGATFAALLRRSSVTVVQVVDFITERWRKVLGNVAANPSPP